MERNEFVNHIENIFEDIDKFFDIIEKGVIGFDYLQNPSDGCSGEIYIVDRDTKQYVNWYKLTHIGRDFHTNMSDEEIVNFLKKLKNASINMEKGEENNG